MLLRLTCFNKVFLRFFYFWIENFVWTQILNNLLRWKFNQHTSNFWSFITNYWFNVTINGWTNLVSQKWILFIDTWNNSLGIIQISMMNWHLLKRNLWLSLNERCLRLWSGHILHGLSYWWLWHSLHILLLNILLRICKLLLLVISLILVIVSFSLKSLVKSVSLIHLIIGLLISLDNLEKRLEHLC